MSPFANQLPVLILAGTALTCVSGCGGSQGDSANPSSTTAKAMSTVIAGVGGSRGKGDVKVVSVDLIRSGDGNAIAVQLRNEGSQNQTSVPISMTVRGASGSTIYANPVRSSVSHVANIPPGSSIWWVADGIRLHGAAKTVGASVSRSHAGTTGTLLDVKDLRVAPGAHGGIDAVGEAVNRNAAAVADVTVAAVATKGAHAVAAGSASIGSVPRRGKASFRVALTGDPSGGVLVATAASSGATAK